MRTNSLVLSVIVPQIEEREELLVLPVLDGDEKVVEIDMRRQERVLCCRDRSAVERQLRLCG